MAEHPHPYNPEGTGAGVQTMLGVEKWLARFLQSVKWDAQSQLRASSSSVIVFWSR